MVARAVFLDRYGVINENVERDGRPVAPTRFEDFRLLPGVEDAVRRLKAAGFVVVVVTNQPDVHRLAVRIVMAGGDDHRANGRGRFAVVLNRHTSAMAARDGAVCSRDRSR